MTAVSVVVATHDRAALLPRLVAAVNAQVGVDLAGVEIVIVDDASTDDTWAVLPSLAASSAVPLQPLRLGRNSGPATARNAGWRASSGELVAFTDDDCTPQPGWLAALVAAARSADLLQGRTVPDPAQGHHVGPFSRSLNVPEADGLYQTCNVAYGRELLQRVGGFDERFRYPCGEDTELAVRALDAGARSAFVADALVHHDVRPSSLLAALRDVPRWQSVVLSVKLHPELRLRCHSPHWWRASHPPAALAGLGLAVLATARRSRSRRLVGAALLLPYLRFRVFETPLAGRRDPLTVAGALTVDLAEVAVCALASVRERTLLL